MVFGKTTTLVVFLIVSLKLSAEVCCDDYKCNLITDSGNCTNHGCIFENQLCRDRKCSDGTSSNCEYYSACKYTGSACVDAPLCSDWSGSADCSSQFEGDGPSSAPCVVSGSACVKATCGMYTTQPTCESGPPSCKWTGSTCAPITSCANYSSANCYPNFVNNTLCILDGTVCKGLTSCADLSGTSTPSCSLAGCTVSGGGCRDTKCSDYGSPTTCNSGIEISGLSGKPCYWDTSCRLAACSDWSSTSSSQCESNGLIGLSCVYNTDNTCSAFTCGGISAGSSCDNSGCYWLSSCPVKENNDGGSASGILAPALLVALLLVLFW